jgi:hypothetical protein
MVRFGYIRWRAILLGGVLSLGSWGCEPDEPKLAPEDACQDSCNVQEACADVVPFESSSNSECKDSCLDHLSSVSDACEEALKEWYVCVGTLTCQEYGEAARAEPGPNGYHCAEESLAKLKVCG